MRAVTLILLLLSLMFNALPLHVLAAPPVEDPDPTPMVIDPRMDRPVLPENPSRADLGSIVYFEYCLACHGDQGQGLTDEYRQMAYGEDMDCWQSKCHATNHPTPGFIFPRVVPPVIGEGTLKRFVNAEDLYQYLLLRMPYYKYDMPPEIPDDDMWNVTAYLLRINGVLPDRIDFDPQQASMFPVHLTARSHGEEQVVQIVVLGSLALVVVGLLVQRGWRSSEQPGFSAELHPSSASTEYSAAASTLALYPERRRPGGILPAGRGFHRYPGDVLLYPHTRICWNIHPDDHLCGALWRAGARPALLVCTGTGGRIWHPPAPGDFYWRLYPPRRLNYLLGLGLFLLALLLDFTGYVLRWDEGIRWALTVGTNLLKTIPIIGQALYAFVVGADQPGATTLTRFYAWHIFGLTAIMLGIFTWHIFRVRRDGGISAPPPEVRSNSQRITRFELVRREILAAVLALIILIVIAARLPAPIAMPIQEIGSLGQADPEAPWFFLWVQQLLRYGDAFWLGIALPLGILALLALLPYLLPHVPADQQGRWFPRAGRIAQVVAALLAAGWLVLTLLELF